MERKAARDMSTRSEKHGLIYEVMVSDGDSKAYIDVFDVYGVCKDCIEVKQKYTNVRDSGFTDWVRSTHYEDYIASHEREDSTCKVVRKRDCCNHVTKNMRKALETVSHSGVKIDGLASVTRSKHGCGPTAIGKIGKRFRSVIIENKITDLEEAKVAAALIKLKSGIMAILYHCTMLEDEELRHQYCPKGADSWCPYRRGVLNWDGKKSHHMVPELLPHLLKIFEARSSECYLRRIVTGYNQNALESLNQLIWMNVSKAKFHGAKRVYTVHSVGLGYASVREG